MLIGIFHVVSLAIGTTQEYITCKKLGRRLIFGGSFPLEQKFETTSVKTIALLYPQGRFNRHNGEKIAQILSRRYSSQTVAGG